VALIDIVLALPGCEASPAGALVSLDTIDASTTVLARGRVALSRIHAGHAPISRSVSISAVAFCVAAGVLLAARDIAEGVGARIARIHGNGAVRNGVEADIALAIALYPVRPTLSAPAGERIDPIDANAAVQARG
jgi:hypothetical protein